jgi:hypothetical protein
MADVCPDCGAEFDEPVSPLCPNCGRALGEASGPPRPGSALVPVLNVSETGLLHLARLTLDQAGMEYLVRDVGMSESYFGRRSNPIIGETVPPLEIVVRAEDAAKARELLANLEAFPTAPPAPEPPEAAAGQMRSSSTLPSDNSDEVVDLFNLETGALIGTVSDAQFETIAEHLEQESTDDDDFYIDGATIAMLEQDGADAAGLALLRKALGTQQGLDIRWERRDKS